MDLKQVCKILLAAIMIFAGSMHFLKPQPFVNIVPRYLKYPLTLVYISGFFEIAGGVGLLVPQTCHYAAIGLIALFIAVFPANVNMAVNHIPFAPGHPPLYAWLRLPFQLLFILWAWWFV